MGSKTPQTVSKKTVVDMPPVLKIKLNETERRPWYKGTDKDAPLFTGSESDLVRKACEVSGYEPDAMAKNALIVEARRILANAFSGKTGRGIAGSTDSRIHAAYNKMVRAGFAPHLITPGRLKSRCVPPLSNATSAERWLQRRGLGCFSPEGQATLEAEAEDRARLDKVSRSAKRTSSPSRKAQRSAAR